MVRHLPVLRPSHLTSPRSWLACRAHGGPALTAHSQPVAPPTRLPVQAKIVPEQPKLICAGSGNGSFHAITMVWPLVCRRLERCPSINSSQLFEELCVQFPGRLNWSERGQPLGSGSQGG